MAGILLPHLEYGMTKSELHSALINRFSLTPEQESCCEQYYILHWTGKWFRKQRSMGLIKSSEGAQYLIVYKDCKPTDILPDSKLFMSFRKPKKEFELQSYVLVSIAY